MQLHQWDAVILFIKGKSLSFLIINITQVRLPERAHPLRNLSHVCLLAAQSQRHRQSLLRLIPFVFVSCYAAGILDPIVLEVTSSKFV